MSKSSSGQLTEVSLALPLGSKRVFTLFPNLAFELRLKIYEAALPSNRIVEVCPMAQKCGGFRPRLTIPTQFLHVSKEARRETLKALKNVYGPHSELYAGYIYPKEDTLFLNDKIFAFRDAVRELDDDLLGRVEYLALDAFSLLFPRFPLSKGLEPLAKFTHLKKLTLVLAYSPPKNSKFVLIDPFTAPLSEWRTSGIKIDDQTLITDETRVTCPAWGRGGVEVSRYTLEGIERLLPVLAEYSVKFPGWRLPTVEVKSLASIRSLSKAQHQIKSLQIPT
jgi:hypothetical protein